jgi:general stress protein YciG
MGIKDRGFASMDRDRQRQIASRGGRAAHEKGTAHEWTREEAREAGRRGGLKSHKRRSAPSEAEQIVGDNEVGLVQVDVTRKDSLV